MKATRFRVLLALSGLLIATLPTSAQVTVNVLYRVVKIRGGTRVCSGFTSDVDGRQYLITARHCLETSTSPTKLEWWHEQTWKSLDGPLILPSNPSVDIAAVRLREPITVQYPMESTIAGISLGQAVFFAGYPYDLASRGGVPMPSGFGEMPFIKSGVMSALDSRRPTAVVLYIDAHNNPGFSGGPVVFREKTSTGFRVAAVVSAYSNEPLAVVKSSDLQNPNARPHDDLFVRGNSGILIAYSIEHIISAIRATPP